MKYNKEETCKTCGKELTFWEKFHLSDTCFNCENKKLRDIRYIKDRWLNKKHHRIAIKYKGNWVYYTKE
jgi:predicted amidophosphoribosyltransferase